MCLPGSCPSLPLNARIVWRVCCRHLCLGPSRPSRSEPLAWPSHHLAFQGPCAVRGQDPLLVPLSPAPGEGGVTGTLVTEGCAGRGLSRMRKRADCQRPSLTAHSGSPRAKVTPSPVTTEVPNDPSDTTGRTPAMPRGRTPAMPSGWSDLEQIVPGDLHIQKVLELIWNPDLKHHGLEG